MFVPFWPLFQIESHLLDLACELERRCVIKIDRRAAVLTDILAFVERVLETRRLIDADLSDVLPVGK